MTCFQKSKKRIKKPLRQAEQGFMNKSRVPLADHYRFLGLALGGQYLQSVNTCRQC